MIKVCLFVGGLSDGQRVEVDVERRIFDLPDPVEPRVVPRGQEVPVTITFSRYRQNLFTTHTPKKDFYIYAPEDWNADQVIGALIEKYPVAK